MVADERTSLSSSRRQGAQRGQAAVEFVLCLFLLLAFVAVMFQALHFELDVFNQSALLRYRALQRARESQDTTDAALLTDVAVQGKNLGDLTFFSVPLQEADRNQHYGPKHLVIRHGTKYWDPIPFLHETWTFSLMLAADHYQDTSGVVVKPFEVLDKLADHIPP
jgi:hypothetical protein